MGFVLRRAGAPEGVGLRGMGEGLTLQEGVEEAGAPLKGGEAGEPGGEGQQGEHGRQDPAPASGLVCARDTATSPPPGKGGGGEGRGWEGSKAQARGREGRGGEESQGLKPLGCWVKTAAQGLPIWAAWGGGHLWVGWSLSCFSQDRDQPTPGPCHPSLPEAPGLASSALLQPPVWVPPSAQGLEGGLRSPHSLRSGSALSAQGLEGGVSPATARGWDSALGPPLLRRRAARLDDPPRVH